MTNDIQELSIDETEAVNGGVFQFLVGVAVGAIASEAIIGFVDGMIQGFQDNK